MKPIYIRNTLSALFAAAIFPVLSGCYTGNEPRVLEGTEQIGSAPTGSIYATNDASIVHVDTVARTATLSNALGLTDGAFIRTYDQDGKETGILKMTPATRSSLRTADIVEGKPTINNEVRKVGLPEQGRLSSIYHDAPVDFQ